MRTFVEHWLRGNPVKNFGEWLIPDILGLFDAHDDINAAGDTCVLALGSNLNGSQVSSLYHKYGKITIWGQGYTPAFGFHEPVVPSHVDIRAVRGPLTQQVCGLPKSIPTGDPGFLIALAHPEYSWEAKSGPVYVPHHALRKLPATSAEYVDILSDRSGFLRTYNRLLSSEFVYTSALHVAIFCLAYRIPFGLVLPIGGKLECHFKFHDVFQWAGIPLEWNYTEEGARAWHNKISGYLLPDLSPLIDAFPYDLF